MFAYPYVLNHAHVFNLNDSFLATLALQDRTCGYADFRSRYLTYPAPNAHMPDPPSNEDPNCQIWGNIAQAASLINPCFNVYHCSDTCPVPWDVLGFPASFTYTPPGATVYFNRSDVQRAINAPIQEWSECSSDVLSLDYSPESGLSVLPSVIERLDRTVITHGQLDYLLLADGTRMMIQNMTWHGQQGFQEEPTVPFVVPYHASYTPFDPSMETLAGAGRMGTTHSERGLTFVETWLAGHMVPEYAPSAAYMQLQFLLGRIDSLSVA